ncbi:glycoside hydrolase family 127 protein, partial [Candidatus Sumerlaeota bacterium]|nr:glycoside hydrolase family 127 protein [Candidatus Sumerlaeota bacterium]
ISVIKISPETPAHFCVRLRIPFWSPSATIALNNETAVCAAAGSYFVIDREWKPKDEINLSLNLTEWIVEGKKETAGKVSIYQGAILLAHDPAFSYVDPANLTPIVLEKSKRNPTSSLAPQTSIRGLYAGGGPIVPITWTKVSVTMKSGSNCVRLRDFATAGATGTPYLTWFPYVVEGSQ